MGAGRPVEIMQGEARFHRYAMSGSDHNQEGVPRKFTHPYPFCPSFAGTGERTLLIWLAY